MTKNKRVTFLCLMATSLAAGQNNSNSHTNSPYSLYGLGQENHLNAGKTNALGGAGIAMPSDEAINNLNPASYASIPATSFMFDIGVRMQRSTFSETGSTQTAGNGNFAHLAFAFALSKRSGIGLSFIPYTKVGYDFAGIETGIEGTGNTFSTDIHGEGGLNNLQLNYGYSITDRLRTGASAAVLFGNISENEVNYISDNILNITRNDYYTGFRFTTGLLYDLSDKTTVGVLVAFPSRVSVTRSTVVAELNAQDEDPEYTSSDSGSFRLPLEVGLGLHGALGRHITYNLDYKRGFWEQTEQTDGLGRYVDKNFVGAGLEYVSNKMHSNFWKRIRYRVGFHHDDGHLAIKDQRVKHYAVSAGVGLPVKPRRHSAINVTYAYGREGQISNGLIKENYHLLTVNFSLEDLWFVRHKYD